MTDVTASSILLLVLLLGGSGATTAALVSFDSGRWVLPAAVVSTIVTACGLLLLIFLGAMWAFALTLAGFFVMLGAVPLALKAREDADPNEVQSVGKVLFATLTWSDFARLALVLCIALSVVVALAVLVPRPYSQPAQWAFVAVYAVTGWLARRRRVAKPLVETPWWVLVLSFVLGVPLGFRLSRVLNHAIPHAPALHSGEWILSSLLCAGFLMVLMRTAGTIAFGTPVPDGEHPSS